MKNKTLILGVIAVMLLVTMGTVFAAHATTKGFDQFGYNYQARNFVGPADGVDRNLDGTVWGDATYANDRLVMKWSKAWDNARFHGAAWTKDAWVDNEWNGQATGGSGEVWHYKIQWVGTCTDGTVFPDGGYCIWGQFEVIMDHGTSSTDYCGSNNGGHQWCALATPNGYGN